MEECKKMGMNGMSRHHGCLENTWDALKITLSKRNKTLETDFTWIALHAARQV